MMRDINPSGKSNTKHQPFAGEQPRKVVDRYSKSITRQKKSHDFFAQESDDMNRHRHIYHRAANKNITREMLRSGLF